MDKIDIFGYERISEEFLSINRFMCIEVKRNEAEFDLIDQIMKYVDWINQEYSYGDYHMIDAYVVAFDYSDKVIQHARKIGIRNYTKGVRDSIQNLVWDNLHLLKYEYDEQSNSIKFSEV